MPPAVTPQTVRNQYFLKEFREFIKKEHAEENFLFMFDKGSNEVIYNKYIKVGSDKEVNISHGLRRPLDALAAQKKWSSMAAGLKAARAEITVIVNSGPVPRFMATPAAKLPLFMLATGVDGSKVATMEALLKVFQTGRSPHDKQEAYAAMLKMTNKALLNPALRALGLQPPAMVIRPKGDPSKALRLLGVKDPLKAQMTKLIADYTKASSKTHRATLIDQMENVAKGVVKEDAILAALKASGLYVQE